MLRMESIKFAASPPLGSGRGGLDAKVPAIVSFQREKA